MVFGAALDEEGPHVRDTAIDEDGAAAVAEEGAHAWRGRVRMVPEDTPEEGVRRACSAWRPQRIPAVDARTLAFVAALISPS